MDRRFVAQLIDLETLIEREQTLEDGLRDLARMTARSLDANRCSVMLLTEDEAGQRLRLCSHAGDLPEDAYADAIPLDAGIAGHVAATGEALLVEDVARSPYAGLAHNDPGRSPSLMSAPIKVADRVIGVINVSDRRDARPFSERDLDLLHVLSLFVGKSIQSFRLQRLAESRVLQMAEVLRQRESAAGESRAICPDPSRLAKLVAKNIYRELASAGFGPNAIIAVSSQVLSELNDSLKRHRERRERLERRRALAENQPIE